MSVNGGGEVNWDLWGELRPRFSSFHGRIRISSSPFNFTSLEPVGSEVLFKGVHRKILLCFPEEIQFSGKVIYVRQGSDSNEILFALHTLSSNTCPGTRQNEFALIPSLKGQKDEQFEEEEYPFSLESNEIENKNLSLRCNICNHENMSLIASRIAPLPSSDWKEGAASWFCGCKHDPGKIIRLADTIRDGVLMWTGTSVVIPYASVDSVTCKRCQSLLGIHQRDSATFWLQSIQILESGESILSSRSSAKNFLSFVNEGLNNSPTILVPKVVLKAEKSTLCLRIMDTKLKVFEGDTSRKICSSNAYKLLYAEGKDLSEEELNEWIRFDVRVSLVQVPEDVITVGLKLLEQNKAYVHPDDHQTKGFKVSFLIKE